MSALMKDIAYLNDRLYHENKKLRKAAEIDDELIKDLGKQLKKARETISKLEAELNEMRMREESNPPRTSELDGIPGTLHGMHAREPLRGPCIGD